MVYFFFLYVAFLDDLKVFLQVLQEFSLEPPSTNLLTFQGGLVLNQTGPEVDLVHILCFWLWLLQWQLSRQIFRNHSCCQMLFGCDMFGANLLCFASRARLELQLEDLEANSLKRPKASFSLVCRRVPDLTEDLKYSLLNFALTLDMDFLLTFLSG